MKGIVFGPIASRRLGRSLGINLTPHKTCNLDCVYCECGKTTVLSNDRVRFYDVENILSEIAKAVDRSGPLDYITFSGSGEPSLYKGISELISKIKKQHSNIKIAVLTNATLFTDEEVFEAFLKADLVLPSVDSVTQEGFDKINRPHHSLVLKDMLESLLKFRKAYKGSFWVEVFICPGINDTQFELEAIATYLKQLDPQKVQVNTLDRPGTEAWVTIPNKEAVARILKTFQGLNVELVMRDR